MAAWGTPKDRESGSPRALDWKDDLIVELQHLVRELRHEVAALKIDLARVARS